MCITGPTGVGKTDVVERLALRLAFPVEIINGDVGQFYEPTSIGTAKPEYRNSPIKQHFFDIIVQPRDLTVTEFRDRLLTLMQDMWLRGVTPLIVGGSSFYLQSIFFPPRAGSSKNVPAKIFDQLAAVPTAQLWLQLQKIDPQRAQSIHPHDRYRIERALIQWYGGSNPSERIPQFEPPGACAFYFLTRDRHELYARINERVIAMLKAGWIEEVAKLDVSWKEFLLKKKLIGYPEILLALENAQKYELVEDEARLQDLISQIQRKTRAYAKRQITFWRMLRKKLEENDPKGAYLKKIEEVNLTILPLDLYIEHVAHELSKLKGLL